MKVYITAGEEKKQMFEDYWESILLIGKENKEIERKQAQEERAEKKYKKKIVRKMFFRWAW